MGVPAKELFERVRCTVLGLRLSIYSLPKKLTEKINQRDRFLRLPLSTLPFSENTFGTSRTKISDFVVHPIC